MNAPFRVGLPIAALDRVCWPVTPIDGESIASLVLRSGDNNAVRRLGKLLQDAGLPFQVRCGRLATSSHPVDTLAILLGVPEDWILERRHTVSANNRLWVTYHGATLRRAHLDYDGRAWAAEALSLSPHVREAWTVSSIPVDGETWEVLAVRCPSASCGATLGWSYTRGAGRCEHCGEDLTAAVSHVLDEDRRASIAPMLNLLSRDPKVSSATLDQIPKVLRSEDRGDLLELAWLLGSVRNRIDYAAIASPRLLDADLRLGVLADGYELLTSWPESPASLFRDAIANDRPDEVNDLVGRFRRLITRRSTFGRASELLDAAMPGVRNLGAITMLAEAFGYVTTRQLATSSGIGESAVLQLRENGLIESKVIRRTSDRAYALYPGDTSSRLRALVDGRTTISAAASILGVSHFGVFDLIEAELLARDLNPILATIFTDILVTGPSVKALTDRLDARVVPGITEGMITLRHGLRSLPAGRKPWSAIVRRILDGSLRVHRSEPGQGLRAASIPACQLPLLAVIAGEVAQDRSSCEFVDEMDAREFMNCTGRQLRALMASGDLCSSGQFSGNTFRISDLEKIAARLVSAVEARERCERAGPAARRAIFHQGSLFRKGQQWADRASFKAILKPYLAQT